MSAVSLVTLQSDEIGELVKAMTDVQAEIENPKKTGLNPHFKSRFAPLDVCVDVIRKVFPRHGFTIHQSMLPGEDGAVIIVTQVSHVSGQWIRSYLPVKQAKPGPQDLGSAITYGRRYSLCAIAGIAPEDEDDDAETAEGRGQSRPSRTESARKAAEKRAPKTLSDGVHTFLETPTAPCKEDFLEVMATHCFSMDDLLAICDEIPKCGLKKADIDELRKAYAERRDELLRQT